MTFIKSIWFWILVVVLLVAAGSVSYYNRFVTLSTGVDAQWAQVENQFQRRFDLIPNLVESVKGIQKQEQAVFGAIADARTHYGAAKTTDEKVAAASETETALGRLLAVVENYPTLTSSQNVSQLMDELSGTENRIAVERGRFNDVVAEYNGTVLRFPGNLFAKLFGYSARPLFAAATGADTAPKVNF